MKPDELERLLRLAPGESLLRGPEQALPRDERARGYAAERLEDIAARLESEGDVQDVLEHQGCTIQHLQWSLGAYFVTPANDAQRLEVLSGAYVELSDGDLLLSGRDRPVVLRVLSPGEPDKVYVLEHGRAEVWSVARPDPGPELVGLNVPGLGDLTGGEAGDPSLEAEFEQLRTSEDALDRLAAPGLLLRFWVPGDRETRNRWLHALAIGESPLLVAVKRWYSSLPGETKRAARDASQAELQRLRETLLRLGSGTSDELKPLATGLALGRDRLESVRRLMATASGGEALTQVLRAFDDFAATHLTQLSDAGLSDERLRRVFVCEPEAWWGAIAG